MSDINNNNKSVSIKERNSLYTLALELESEEDNEDVSIDTIMKRLKSKSGIINLLKKNFNFDIEKISKRSEKDKHEMYELLKIIYNFKFKSDDISDESKINGVGANEYVKKIKSCADNPQKNKRSLLKLFSKPSLENLNTEFSKASKFGDVHDDLFKIIKSYVDDSEERYRLIYEEKILWEQLIGVLNFWVFGNLVPGNEKYYEIHLARVNKRMGMMLERLKNINITFDFNKLENKEGVFKTFFNLLTYYEIICNNSDKIKMNSVAYYADSPDKEYIDIFKQVYKNDVNMYELDQIEENINNLSTLSDNELWKLITYGKYNESVADLYKFAIRYYKTVVNWIYKRQVDEARNKETPAFGYPKESNRMNVYNAMHLIMKEECSKKDFDIRNLGKTGGLVSVFQELFFIHIFKPTFENKHLKYNSTHTQLTKAIKDKGKANAALIRYITRRVENRLAMNLGVQNLMNKKREIESKIYEIKGMIFKYQNIDDMVFVNEMIAHFLYLLIIDDEDVIGVWKYIYDILVKYFTQNNLQVDIVIGAKNAKRIVSLWRELKCLDLYEFKQFMNEIIYTLDRFYMLKDNRENKTLEFKATCNITQEVACVVYYSLSEDKMSFNRFEYKCDKKIYDRIKTLGLDSIAELFSC